MSNSELFSQFKPCTNCTNGFLITKNNYSIKCTCRIAYEKQLAFIYKLVEANLITLNSSKKYLEDLINYTLESYKGKDTDKNIPKIRLFIEEFEEKYSYMNLFFSGIPGTQKTTLAKHIIVEILRKNKSGYYILVNDYIKLAEESIRDEAKKKKLELINQVDLLVLDECDQEKLIMYHSNWKESNFFPQIKYRLEMIKKATIFCSNKDVTNLGEKFQGAIQNLIERETTEGIMIFSDKYSVYKEKVDLNKIWEV